MPRYSRDENGRIVTHFESLEELRDYHPAVDSPEEEFGLGCVVLVAVSTVAAYHLIHYLGLQGGAKWLRACIYAAFVIPAGILGYKFGWLIQALIMLGFALLVLIAVGAFLWWLI